MAAFQNPFPEEAERLVALSEGMCILCRPPSRLNDDRVCAAGVQWNIRTGEGHQYRPPLTLEEPPAKGLWQIMQSDSTNYKVPKIDPMRYVQDRYAEVASWPMPEVEVSYDYAPAEIEAQQLIEATRNLAKKMIRPDSKWAKFAKLYGGIPEQ